MANDKAIKGNALKDFQDAVMDFVTKVPNALIKAAGNDPDAQLVLSNVETVRNIFRDSFAKMDAAFNKSNSLVQEEALEFLALSNGTEFTKSVQERAVGIIGKKLFGGNIWQWIGQNLTEIKKIVGMILGLFSKKLQKWWDKIAVIIDQFWALIISLLASVFGFSKAAIARDLSYAEVNHLNEMAALARLQAASTYSDDNEEF